jgi:hypothetical protein
MQEREMRREREERESELIAERRMSRESDRERKERSSAREVELSGPEL